MLLTCIHRKSVHLSVGEKSKGKYLRIVSQARVIDFNFEFSGDRRPTTVRRKHTPGHKHSIGAGTFPVHSTMAYPLPNAARAGHCGAIPKTCGDGASFPTTVAREHLARPLRTPVGQGKPSNLGKRGYIADIQH